jgi:hypothetical protein
VSSLVSNDLQELEDALKQLRIAYERYFAGIERIEPTRERDAVRKRLHLLMGGDSKNTARRFRLQSLQASLVTYEQHWNRITRQIEEGTFKRDKLRAERILRGPTPGASAGLQTDPDPEPELDGLEGLDDLDELGGESRPDFSPGAALRPGTAARRPTQPGIPASPARAPAPVAPASHPPGATGATLARAAVSQTDSVRRLHAAYVETRQGLGEGEPVSLEAFSATLEKQASAIKARFNCKDVEFKVAVKDGKTILKATPR